MGLLCASCAREAVPTPTSSRPSCLALPVAASCKVLPVMPCRQPAPITQPAVWFPQGPAAELHILLQFLVILQVLLEACLPSIQNHPQGSRQLILPLWTHHMASAPGR